MPDASPDILARGVVATVLSWVVIEVVLKQTNPVVYHHVRYNNIKLPPLLFLCRKYGVVETTRRCPYVPFGFTRPVVWTESLPTEERQKTDALPADAIRYLTFSTPGGNRIGTSLFIDGCPNRMRRKERYLKGVLPTDDFLKPVFRAYHFRGEHAQYCHEYCLYNMAALTCRLHFGQQDEEDRVVQAVVHLAVGLTRVLNNPLDMTLPDPYDAKTTVRDAIEKVDREETTTIVGRWKRAGFSDEDIFVEFVHNVFGMTLQWSVLLFHTFQLKVSLPLKQDDVRAFIVRTRPSPVAASRSDDSSTLLLHPLGQTCGRYDNFGLGNRRCPGEELTYAMLTTLHHTPFPMPSPPSFTLGLFKY